MAWGDERIRQPYTHDRADQRMRAGSRQAEIPGTDVPHDRRYQECEHHSNPAPEPTFKTSSTGRRANTPKATAPLEVSTPIRFQHPDQITATTGRSERV